MGGVRAAVRELPGVTRQEAQRAIKIDGITPEAHDAARQAGNDNQSALLKIACYADEDVILRPANGLAERET